MALALILRKTIRPLALSQSCRPAGFQSKKWLTPICRANNQAMLLPKASIDAIWRRKMSEDHSKMWGVEKVVTLSLLGLIPGMILQPGHKILDDIVCLLVLAHMFWGSEAILADYARPIILGKILPKIATLLLYLVTIAVAGGLLNMNHNYVPVSCLINRIWEYPEKTDDEDDEKKK